MRQSQQVESRVSLAVTVLKADEYIYNRKVQDVRAIETILSSCVPSCCCFARKVPNINLYAPSHLITHTMCAVDAYFGRRSLQTSSKQKQMAGKYR